MVAAMGETTNQIKVTISNIVVKIFGSSFRGRRTFIPKSLNLWGIKQKKKMTIS